MIPAWCTDRSQSCAIADLQEHAVKQGIWWIMDPVLTSKTAETYRPVIQWGREAQVQWVFRVGRWIRSGCSEGAEWQDRDRKDALQFCMSNSQQLLVEQSTLYLHHCVINITCALQNYSALLNSFLTPSFVNTSIRSESHHHMII